MHRNNSISAIAVLDLARELAQLNILDSESLLRLEKDFENHVVSHPNQADMTMSLERRMPEDVLVNLWRLAAANLEYPEVGILIGSKVNNEAKGVLANWISQCETLDEAFSIFNDNIVLLNAAENWTLERREESIKLNFNFSSQYEYPIAAIERSMTALVMWASYLCGGSIMIESASFRHAAPEYKDQYRAILGSTVIFSADENSLVLKAAVFDRKIKNANPYLQQVIATRAQKLLLSSSVVNENVNTLTRVRELLYSDLVQFNSVESVCLKMHLSRASLYRKLKAEGVTFRELLETVQVEKYHQGIERGLAVNDLCELLGFSDPSTFYKAKKRWEKVNSPSILVRH
ncbi:MAG: AraC family transcriptional regulator ligand-binding domain-containing protein [Oleispira sp.]